MLIAGEQPWENPGMGFGRGLEQAGLGEGVLPMARGGTGRALRSLQTHSVILNTQLGENNLKSTVKRGERWISPKVCKERLYESLAPLQPPSADQQESS